MARILASDQLGGIYAKLERADENIRNLNTEITSFLGEKPAGGFSEEQQKRLAEWAEFHAKRGVPPRFGVLAGEIAHLLRSSLDNIAWILSSDSYRKSHERSIGFPIFVE